MSQNIAGRESNFQDFLWRMQSRGFIGGTHSWGWTAIPSCCLYLCIRVALSLHATLHFAVPVCGKREEEVFKVKRLNGRE